MAISQIQSASLASGVPASSNMPSGSVLQVVQGTYTTQVQTTSTSFVTTNLTATITPKFSTSKILVQVQAVCGNNAYAWHHLTIYRNGSTNIAGGSGNAAGYVSNGSSVNDYLETINFQILDSPATTSATTYALYQKAGGGNTIRSCPDSIPGYILLMEIAG